MNKIKIPLYLKTVYWYGYFFSLFHSHYLHDLFSPEIPSYLSRFQ